MDDAQESSLSSGHQTFNGHLSEFCTTTGNMAIYHERFEAFARVNKLDKQSKTDMLIMIPGDGTYITLRNLIFPEPPEKKTYQRVKLVLLSHYMSKQSAVTECYNFHKRT